MKVFPKYTHDEIVNTDVGSLHSFGTEQTGCNVQMEPIGIELCHPLVGNR